MGADPSVIISDTLNTFATLPFDLRKKVREAWTEAGIQWVRQDPEKAREIMREHTNESLD